MSAATEHLNGLREAVRRQVIDGRSFILDAPDHVPAIFGHDREVLWAEGESLLLVGPQGVGKTTLMQQLALRRAGVLADDLLGYPVQTDSRRATLYLALDRPQQIARSFKRMVGPQHGEHLENFIVWPGPLPFNIVKAPERLMELILVIGEDRGLEIGTLCIDSIKDIAMPLSSDEVGAAVNLAIARVIAAGVEVVATHHGRKATSENKKPTSLSDVYGSTWITAGTGSVLLLWGEPGDPIVELTHLKQPADEVGPLEISHDHQHGASTRQDRLDAWTALNSATVTGITTTDAAIATYGPNPTKAEIEKARRRLDRFTEDGRATKITGSQKGDPTRYWPISTVEHRGPQRGPSTNGTRPSTNGSVEPHAASTPAHRPTVPRLSPLKGGDVDGSVDHPHATDRPALALVDSREKPVHSLIAQKAQALQLAVTDRVETHGAGKSA
jgi:replicative DNA helicase